MFVYLYVFCLSVYLEEVHLVVGRSESSSVQVARDSRETFGYRLRVARLKQYILWLQGYILWLQGTFYGYKVHFMATRYILWLQGYILWLQGYILWLQGYIL